MRNKDENKHRKGQESTIGKIIYEFLLFMPLLAIGSTLLISTFNMSAKEETEIHYKYESNEVNSFNDLIVGHIYKFDFKNMYSDNIVATGSIFFQPLSQFKCYCGTDELYMNTDWMLFPIDKYQLSDTYLYVGFDEIDNYAAFNNIEFDNSFVAIWLGSEINSQFNVPLFTYTDYNEIESVETHNLDTQEVFYRAVDKVTESPLFSWAENSIIYTTTHATCTQLSITTPFIPLLMSYWLIISVIYFLYDIALMLVWLIHRKIHELQESL